MTPTLVIASEAKRSIFSAKGKQFFFEKKNQKTSYPAGYDHTVATAPRTKFFCFFLFTKRSAYFLWT